MQGPVVVSGAAGGGSGTVTSVAVADSKLVLTGTPTIAPIVGLGTLVPGSNGVPTLAAADASVTVGGTATARTVGLPLSAAVPLAGGTPAAGTSTTKANDDHRHPGRTTYCFFTSDNMPASASSILQPAGASGNHANFVVTRDCTLVAISAALSVAVAGSAALVQISVNNGAADATLTLTLAIAATKGRTVGTGVNLSAGDLIKLLYVTDGSYTSTTSDITALLETQDR